MNQDFHFCGERWFLIQQRWCRLHSRVLSQEYFKGAHLVIHLQPCPTGRNMLTSTHNESMHRLKLQSCFQLLHTLAILTKAVNNINAL